MSSQSAAFDFSSLISSLNVGLTVAVYEIMLKRHFIHIAMRGILHQHKLIIITVYIPLILIARTSDVRSSGKQWHKLMYS